MNRSELTDLTRRFLDAFNRNDLDEVMAFFAADGTYEEFNGTCSVGKEAIRRAFEPQFGGAFGEMRFDDEDLIVDEEAGKVMTSWCCHLELEGKPISWRGLDLLHFAGGKLNRKLTYAKAKVPLFE